VKNHINRFVLKITFIRIYIYNFLIKIFIEKRNKSCVFGDRWLSRRLRLWNRREYIKFEIRQTT
jgi:hypothetical protein